MSLYEEGRAAFRADISLNHARHWPPARRELWSQGWLDAAVEDHAAGKQDFDRIPNGGMHAND